MVLVYVIYCWAALWVGILAYWELDAPRNDLLFHCVGSFLLGVIWPVSLVICWGCHLDAKVANK